MKSREIRQSFLDYFAQRDHRVFPSAPLVPHGDATLLFTNAGMVPFKNVFLGAEAAEAPRAASSQKCLRVSGKHNDLENVGPSRRHHTFFEMLGNFSFGDYFKEEAIAFAWELVTGVWQLPKEHLFATVFETDDEAHDLWGRISDLPPERILRCGAKDNFWSMGEVGPCGPCSEIFVDTDPDKPLVDWQEGDASGRYLEIWNLVFMESERREDGSLTPLPNPSIDTGAGLERLASVLQRVGSNYETDLFRPVLEAAATLAGTSYGARFEGAGSAPDTSLRVIADHLRAVTFLLADGVIPGNEGRGYVLRRILRRALRHGLRLGLEEPFLHRLVPVVEETLGGAYDELAATQEATVATVRAEEEKFLGTVASGARQLQEEIEAAREQGLAQLSGAQVFQLYDTHGMPLEVIEEIAEEERFTVDRQGFEEELEQQRKRSRAATGEGQRRLQQLQQVLTGSQEGGGEEVTATAFDGYGCTELDQAKVLRLARLTADQAVAATALSGKEGDATEGAVVLDRTVFYAEGGGQVGDVGELRWDGGRARVTDTRKNNSGVIFHLVTVLEGQLQAGQQVSLHVDSPRRHSVERNHTATHLLHAALREVLGTSVRQAGSLVAPDRLRFDFTYPRPVSDEERRRIEDLVNHWVLEAQPTRIEEQSYQEAVAAGAMALFGEKYGDVVRTVAVPGEGLRSLELCGGCHVANTGAIGPFLITAEQGIASGVRRIEAVTGAGALERVREQGAVLASVEEALGAPAAEIPARVETLRAQLKERDAELAKMRLQLVSGAGAGGGGAEEVAGVAVNLQEVPFAPVPELRNMADSLRSKQGSGVVVLGAAQPGKVMLLAAVSEDLVGRVHAGKVVKAAAQVVGGGGGGRPDFAQAGGKDADKLPEALDAAREEIRQQLEVGD
ncbi:MAG: alanine--tRNA ligase [Acidobacteriota bacterium]|nr:alanine--tRNA ligase [Acidobacteriota bacterium]